MLNPTTETNDQVQPDTVLNWSADAPKGGSAVMRRILKDGATVPLFFAQTFIASLRDVGYNNTTSAVCEHIDNAIQARATEVRVFFRQTGKQPNPTIDVGVYDNGTGMAPHVLKVATAFGGSMNFNNRDGIGRFGMGMKTAALNMSPVLDLYSWQEPGAIYNMTLDVEAIGKERANSVELPDPALHTALPDEIAELFTAPLSWPNVAEQSVMVGRDEDLTERLGRSGTIVYMPECDRLTSAKSRTLAENAVKEAARVYRRQIAAGLKLYVNNRLVEAFDPTYSMADARHVKIPDLQTRTSRLLFARNVAIPVSENASETASITVKLYRLPIEEWYHLSRKVQRNDLQVFNRLIVSVLRNDREVYAGPMPDLLARHTVTNWYRVQIDFPGVLDEAFGVAANKQGIRPKAYVIDALTKSIGQDLSTLNEELKQFQGAQASARKAAKPSSSEAKATEADTFQADPISLTPDEAAQLEANLRTLALALKREGETDEEAFERIKASKYLIEFKHDPYWPFYHVESRFGRVILTLNTAHPFFERLYEPVRRLAATGATADDADGSEASHEDAKDGPLIALELLLTSLGRAHSQIAANSEDAKKALETMRRVWSETYRVQLTA